MLASGARLIPQPQRSPGVSSTVRRTLLTAASVLIALLLLAPAASAATRKAIWGHTRLPDGTSAFPTYKKLGVKTYQIALRWDRTALRQPTRPTDPSDPAYRWPGIVDEAVREARRYGIKVALIVTGSPSWANGGRTSEWAPGVRHYTNFLQAATRRYRSVKMWMIWGEPSLRSRWMPLPSRKGSGVRRYASLLDASYVALKRRSKRNIVIGGGSITYGDVPPTIFIKNLKVKNRRRNGRGPATRPARLDWYLHNPYSRRFPNIRNTRLSPNSRDMSDVDLLYKEVGRVYRRAAKQFKRRGARGLRRYYKKYRKKGPKLWLSEFSVSSDHGNSSFGFYVTREQQARYLAAAFKIARKARYVAGIGWFKLYDDPPNSTTKLTNGLFTYDMKPKPAYHAYKKAR